MILYHGSYKEISRPDVLHSRINVDFGRGFYTTPILEQAEIRTQVVIDEYLHFEGSRKL